MKKTLIYFLVLAVVGLTAYSLYCYQGKNKTSENILENQEQTGTPVGEGNIRVISPKEGDTVGLPLKVLGEARVFENQLNVRIVDANGKIIKEEGIMAEGDGEMGEFNLFGKAINYEEPGTRIGTIEFFDYSAKDGSEIDKVIIAVKFEKIYNALNVKVFFGNNIKNPGAEDCSKVFSVSRRIPYTQNTGEEALKELLAGVTAAESEKGYFTTLNFGVKLNSLNIKNGTAYVDFDEALQSQVGGSCRVTSIRAQIEKTLKQFGTVNEVVISIDGKTEDILQP